MTEPLPKTNVDDPYLSRMLSSKKVNAVAKSEFASFASAIPENHLIFAYEGPADKCVFYHWIKRLREDLTYEPYVAKNKHAVLQLFDALKTDQTGLGDMVYYFVDHDFDHLQGRQEDDRIFLTDTYSIENYLVCKEVLEDILKFDFHCDGHPGIRNGIIELFCALYREFLDLTNSINFRLFLSRALKIRRDDDLPTSINSLADVQIDSVKPAPFDAKDVVKLEREPTDEEIARCKIEFDKINPEYGYRGKFSLLFFSKWLLKLRADRLTDPSIFFKEVPAPGYAINGDFSLERLAPKSPAPKHLSIFIAKIVQ